MVLWPLLGSLSVGRKLGELFAMIISNSLAYTSRHDIIRMMEHPGKSSRT